MRSGEEIQKALTRFSAKWATFEGSEKAEAQTFLNQLFDCYGSDRTEVGARFEDFKSSAGFMDLHWPGVCIVEMKAPHVSVSSARDQVRRYWRESSDEDEDIPAARWVVLCNFREFEVWEPGRFPKSPRAKFSLEALPDRYEALMFLTGPEQVPSFLEQRRVSAVTAPTCDRFGADPGGLPDPGRWSGVREGARHGKPIQGRPDTRNQQSP